MVDADHRVEGWRLLLGKVSHTVCDYPDDLSRIVPEGVQLVGTPLGVGTFDTDSVTEARGRRLEAARRLDEWGVDCIVAGGGPTHAAAGPDEELEAIEAIDAAVSAPFTTSLEAQVDALRSLGAEAVLLVTPFPDEREREQVAYFEGRGFEVVAADGPVVRGSRGARDVPRSAAYRAARALDRRVASGYDAVLVAGAPFGSIEHVDPLEADLGRPVVVSAAAQAKAAFRMGGIEPATPGYGTLLAGAG